MTDQRGSDVRRRAYEILRKIERQLDDLRGSSDLSIIATLPECEKALAEIRANLEPNG